MSKHGSNNLMVSISCVAYNHEKYIHKAIESFLMQRTNFAYEVLIHDDASTDHTASIIREYEKKYPDIIKPVYQSENQWSKGVRVDFEFNYKRARGKYVAICDGDDYWTDPYKLQKQVDFLEKNDEFSICFHSIQTIDEKGNKVNIDKSKKEVKRVTGLSDIIKGNYISAVSVLFRNGLISDDDFYTLSDGLYFDDWIYHILNAEKGLIYFFNEPMAAYRLTKAGLSRSTDKIRRIEDKLKFYSRLKNHFDDEQIVRICEKAMSKLEVDLFIDYAEGMGFRYAKEALPDISRADLILSSNFRQLIKLFLLRFFANKYGQIKATYKRLKVFDK